MNDACPHAGMRSLRSDRHFKSVSGVSRVIVQSAQSAKSATGEGRTPFDTVAFLAGLYQPAPADPGPLTPRQQAADLIRQARRADHGRAVAMRDAWAERMAICTIDGMSEADAERVALAELAGMVTGGHNALDTGRNLEIIIP